MTRSDPSEKTGLLHALGEVFGLLRAGLGALVSGWPQRQAEVDAPAAPIAEPGDPTPVLETLEQLKHKAETAAPYPVND